MHAPLLPVVQPPLLWYSYLKKLIAPPPHGPKEKVAQVENEEMLSSTLQLEIFSPRRKHKEMQSIRLAVKYHAAGCRNIQQLSVL